MRRRLIALSAAVLLIVGCGSDAVAEAPKGSAEVEITTPDGVVLEATVAGNGPLGVIVAHGSNASRANWYVAGGELAESGDFTVVMINLRGYGGSTGSARTNQDVDILASLDWLAGQSGISSVSLMGSSMGATSVLDAAGDRPDDVHAVVALSPPRQSASMDALAAVPNLTMPVMLAVAAGDTAFVESTSAIGGALGIDPTITEGDGHGTGMFADNPNLVAEIADFLRRA